MSEITHEQIHALIEKAGSRQLTADEVARLRRGVLHIEARLTAVDDALTGIRTSAVNILASTESHGTHILARDILRTTVMEQHRINTPGETL